MGAKYTVRSLRQRRSIKVYQSFIAISIMLALCLMLLVTNYAQNYAGIISWSLTVEPHNSQWVYHLNNCSTWLLHR